jgi:methyl-accepting chemotaxis protein
MMRIHSIRFKVILPIAFLAVILVGLFGFMLLMTKVQNEAIRKQAEHYFEAVSVVLNADRDLYQARIAREKLLHGEGKTEDNLNDFNENAQQVHDRFNKFREYLADEPEIINPFQRFDSLYDKWLAASKTLIQSGQVHIEQSDGLQQLEQQFQAIREMLNNAGDGLRQHTRDPQVQQQQDLNLYVEAISEVLNADRDIYQARLALLKFINGTGVSSENKQDFEENVAQVLQRFHNYRSYLIREPQLAAPYEKFDLLLANWLKGCRQLMNSTHQQQQQLSSEQKAADVSFADIRQVLDEAGEAIRQHARTAKEEVKKTIDSYQRIAMVIIGIAFIIALLFGYFVPLRLTQNVNNMTQRIREIAEGDGDLTQRINSSAKDELGDLAKEFDGFVEHLRNIILNIQSQSAALGDTTQLMNQVADQAGNITSALVNASDSIVSASSEMSMSNQQMAELAKGTAAESNNSSQLTNEGISVVNQANNAIEALVSDIETAQRSAAELEQSSDAIASVLEVIRKIAEQTNLLALNAAIEAARAGEQGRGFAVVSDEVRVLATRTQASTDEIESMIERLRRSVQQSSQAIHNSRGNADNTVENFSEVIRIFNTLKSSFDDVQGMAEQTAQATEEQFTVANHINQNLVSLKEQTDSVRTMSAQVQQQSNHLSELYQQLSKQVESFRV